MAAHLSLDRLSAATKIQATHLQALEANQFDALPSAAYVRGYIRAVARELRVDPAPLLSILRRDYKESGRGKLQPRELLSPPAPKTATFTRINFVALLSLVFLGVVIGYSLVQWFIAAQPPKLLITTPGEYDRVSAITAVSGKTSPDAVLTVNDVSAPVANDGTFSIEVTFPSEGIQSVEAVARNARGLESAERRQVVVVF